MILTSLNVTENASFSHTFNKAGTFKYYCSLHASMMMGEVTVIDPNGNFPSVTFIM